jgi:transposase InsO family protein
MTRNEIMSHIHTHIGIEGCLKRARECAYWQRMNSELRDYISKCDVCQTYGLKQPKETLKSHDIPTIPWVKIGTDLFCFSENYYLITMDYYSSFFEIDRLYDTSSKTVISKLKQHFARWGIPETVIPDNGPQYSSEQFKNFSRLWDFKHKTSSPGHAQSNGKVENAVKSAKRIMRKAKKSNSDPFISLLNFRNTPQQVTDYRRYNS